MEVSGLEATLIAGAIATAAAWISTAYQAHRYQTKGGCDDRHRTVCQDGAKRDEKLEDIEKQNKTDTALMMRMLREIVIHLPIPEQHKANILNDRGGK